MASERLQYLIDAIWRGSPEAKKAAGDIRDVGEAGKSTRERLTQLGQGLSAAATAFGVISGGVKAAWEVIGQGAELDLARSRFDNLTASIGTTSDALMNRLRGATSGMMSDAELMSSASEIIRLGLMDTEDGVVRLARVVGEMGWDMQQVIQTFGNDSVMRLDQLGLSLTDVRERTERLVAEGYEFEKAFDLAVLEAGEAQLKLFGSAAGTVSGDMAKVETALINVKDRTLEYIAVASGPAIHQMVGGYAEDLKVMVDSQLEAADSTEELIEVGQRLSKITGFQAWFTGTSGVVEESTATIVQRLAQTSGSLEEFQANLDAAFGQGMYIDELDLHTGAVGEVAAIYESFTTASEAAAVATYEARRAGIEVAQAMEGPVASAFGAAMSAVEDYTGSVTASADETYEMRREGIDSSEALREKLVSDYEEQKQATEELEEATRALRTEFAGEFKSALEAGDTETQDFTGAMFDAAVQAGANEEALILLAGATGDYTQEQIEAALETAAMKAKAEELGAAIAEGTITVQDAISELGIFQEQLSNPYAILVDSEQAQLAEQRAREARLAVLELDGTHASVTVTTHFDQVGTPYSGPYDVYAPGYQSGTGGWQTVPGPMGAPYPVVLHGGERFNVAPVGQTPPADTGNARAPLHIENVNVFEVEHARGLLEELEALTIGGVG